MSDVVSITPYLGDIESLRKLLVKLVKRQTNKFGVHSVTGIEIDDKYQISMHYLYEHEGRTVTYVFKEVNSLLKLLLVAIPQHKRRPIINAAISRVKFDDAETLTVVQ